MPISTTDHDLVSIICNDSTLTIYTTIKMFIQIKVILYVYRVDCTPVVHQGHAIGNHNRGLVIARTT